MIIGMVSMVHIGVGFTAIGSLVSLVCIFGTLLLAIASDRRESSLVILDFSAQRRFLFALRSPIFDC